MKKKIFTSVTYHFNGKIPVGTYTELLSLGEVESLEVYNTRVNVSYKEAVKLSKMPFKDELLNHSIVETAYNESLEKAVYPGIKMNPFTNEN